MPLNTRLVSYLLTLGCLSIPFALEATPALTPQQLEQALTAAQQAYGQKKYQQALPHFARFYAQNPFDHGVALQYAYTLIQEEQAIEAIEVLHFIAAYTRQPAQRQQAQAMLQNLILRFPQYKPYQREHWKTFREKKGINFAKQQAKDIQYRLSMLNTRASMLRTKIEYWIEITQTIKTQEDLRLRDLELFKIEFISFFSSFSHEMFMIDGYGSFMKHFHIKNQEISTPQTQYLFQPSLLERTVDNRLGTRTLSPLLADLYYQSGRLRIQLAKLDYMFLKQLQTAAQNHPSPQTKSTLINFEMRYGSECRAFTGHQQEWLKHLKSMKSNGLDIQIHERNYQNFQQQRQTVCIP